MPQSKSSAKRLRQNKKRRERNHARRSTLKTSIRVFQEKLAQEDREAARNALQQVYAQLDKAVSKRIIKKNHAARKKSRLTRKLNSAFSS